MSEADYRLIYYSIVLAGILLTGIINPHNRYGNDNWLGCIILIIVSVFIGYRPLEVGTDTISYSYWFENVRKLDWGYIIHDISFGTDSFFYALWLLCSKIGDYSFTLFITCFLTNILYFKASQLLAKPLNISASLMYFLILSSSTCWTQEVNVIRSGLAISAFSLYLYYLWKGEKTYAIIFGILALGTHFSTAIFIGLSILVKLCRNISVNKYIWLYIIVLCISAVGYSILSFDFMQELEFDKVEAYTTNIGDSIYNVGFRPTFALFNSFFLIVFLKYRNKQIYIQEFFIKLYTIFSCVFFLWFAIPYSDRIGAYSWILIPIILSLIFAENRRKRTIGIYTVSIVYFCICFIIPFL